MTERTAQPCKPVKLSLSAVPFPTDAPLPVKSEHDLEMLQGSKRVKIGTLSKMEFVEPTLGKETAPLPVMIQQAHDASRRQSAMFEACAIASELGRVSRENDDPEPLAALMRHVGTQEHATLQLLKLVGRIGLREWFDNDFVVLSKAQARSVADCIDKSGFGSAYISLMNHKIKQADQ